MTQESLGQVHSHSMLSRQYALNPLNTKKEILELVRGIPITRGETLKSLSQRLEWGPLASVVSSTLFIHPYFSTLKL